MIEPDEEKLRDILGRPIDGLQPPPLVYVPEFGFRTVIDGLRLVAPVTVEAGGRTLTVDRLVSTPRATEVRFELVGLSGSWQEAMTRVTAMLRDATARTYAPGRSWHATLALDKGIQRTAAFEPLPADLRQVELVVSDGPVTIAATLALEPLATSGLPAHQVVDASDSHHDVTLRVAGVAFGPDVTVLDLEALAGGSIRWLRGIGALMGIRRGPTKLRLRDEAGTELTEQDPTLPPRDPTGRRDTAVFPAVPPHASRFELHVEYVFAEEAEGEVRFELPIGEPHTLRFGTHAIRVLRSSIVGPDTTLAQSMDPRRDQSAVRIDLDLGDWHDDRRLLQPGTVLIDGVDNGFRWTPEPGRGPTNGQQVSYVAIPSADPSSARTVTFRGPTIHLRGPWTIRFSRPR